jgi:hypothetical protein
MQFLKSITTDEMYARMHELAKARPDVDLVLKLLGDRDMPNGCTR